MRTVKYIDVTNMTEAELVELLENASENLVIEADDEEEGGAKRNENLLSC